MRATATQAIVPKARGMFAKRISAAEYEEMLRRRSVTELAAILKRHPYFGGSLSTLSSADPHRGQIEELLDMDLFLKYEALVRYDFSQGGFTRYFLAECEMEEFLKVMHLCSIGLPGAYLPRVPAYLVGKTRVDLLTLARARSFEEIVEAARGTAYHKALRAHWLRDPALRSYPLAEAAVIKCFYAELFARLEQSLAGRERETVRGLFLQRAEVYNLELIMRVKLYFAQSYPPAELARLLLPYRFRVRGADMREMVNARGAAELPAIYKRSGAAQYLGAADPDELSAAGSRRLYRLARRTLHLTALPAAAMAAFLLLAKLEKQNVVNVVEGVRYGVEPERVRTMLSS